MSVIEDKPSYGNMKSCAFCGQKRKLTKEHIWPKWLSTYLPYREQRSPHYVMNSMGEMKTGKLHRPGDLHAQTLKIVCKECNSGWMSWLQSVAKNQLVPLLHDEWRPLHDDSINTIKAWIVMYTMVSEFSDPDTATIPEHQRTHLMASVVSARRGGVAMLKNAVPNGWAIWLGRSDPEGDHPGRMNHFGGSLAALNQHGAIVPLPFQITGFTVGKLLILAVTQCKAPRNTICIAVLDQVGFLTARLDPNSKPLRLTIPEHSISRAAESIHEFFRKPGCAFLRHFGYPRR